MKSLRNTFLSLLALVGLATTAHAQTWVQTFNGPGNSTDIATSMALDNAGNVYVTGSSMGAGTGNDIITNKYSSAGVLLWSRRYNAPANLNDAGKCIAVDSTGNVYVAGESNGGATSGIDFLILKYNTAGGLLWQRRYGATGSGTDSPVAMALKSDGAVVITGYSVSSTSSYDFLTVKYGSDGSLLWTRRYNGPANGVDFPSALKVDNSGNVYVAGTSAGVGTGYDYATIKYSSEGAILWSRRYNGTGNGNDMARAMAIDSSYNVYVTGQSKGTALTGDDIVTLKYNSSGAPLWQKRYSGPGAEIDFGSAIGVDSNQNVYVTGTSEGGATGKDFVTIRYDNLGNTVWVKRYNRDISDSPVALIVNDGGKVYVLGTSLGATSGTDMVLLVYDPNGILVYSQIYNGPANSGEIAFDLQIADGGGSMYLCGLSTGVTSGADGVVIKYNP